MLSTTDKKCYLCFSTGANCFAIKEHQSEKWYLVRRSSDTKKWHPKRDFALGTMSYGTVSPNPVGTTEPFSVKYSEFK